MSTQWDTRHLYLCDYLENRFSGHGTFALSTIEVSTLLTMQTVHTTDYADSVDKAKL